VALAPAEAVERAAAALNLVLRRDVRVLAAEGTRDRATLVSPGGISLEPIPARLIWQTTGAGDIRLAWNLEIQEISQEHWWNVAVDAQTGALLSRIDFVDHDDADVTASAVSNDRGVAEVIGGSPEPVDDGSSYRVYALPLESPNDGDRTLVENPADAVGSPFGWHDTDGAAGPEHTVTRGNNVHAYVDPTPGANTPLPLMDAEGGSGLDFDFDLDFALPPTAWKDAAVANLFYWNNVIHDGFYRYGFDEASGNFQANTYGRGGTGGDPVQAEAQDGSGVNNANFATPADGTSGRMQMYMWPNQGQQRIIDGDLDAGVIVHEYAHGISNRLTGGPSNVSCLRTHDEREGEGWSDWLALALTALPSESGEQARGMGTYVLGEPNRQADGIRITPYSTDMSINPSTYNTVKTAAEPHGVGYVWATMLWEVYWALVGEHGFNPNPYDDWTTGGNNLAIQLVMDGMKFQPCEPGFEDARDAVIAADQALTEGENRCLIWVAFAKRGLGVDAEQNDPASKTDGVEGYEVPADCTA
jgi:extracellular elastinolytic metalloproteinase